MNQRWIERRDIAMCGATAVEVMKPRGLVAHVRPPAASVRWSSTALRMVFPWSAASSTSRHPTTTRYSSIYTREPFAPGRSMCLPFKLLVFRNKLNDHNNCQSLTICNFLSFWNFSYENYVNSWIVQTVCFFGCIISVWWSDFSIG